MNSDVFYFVLGYGACLVFSAFSALVDLILAKSDNKILFRKILKSILKGTEFNA